MIAPINKCPVAEYAEAVMAGEIVAGRLVRLACARHLRDLENGHERGIVFDPVARDRALKFFGYLTLPEGNKKFVLAGWQQFVIGCLFGWKGADGYRRFRTAYIEAGKGCGKTPLAAGIGLFGLVADGEPAAEIYTAGVTRDQASYLLNDATRLVESSPALKAKIDINAHNLSVESSGSYMRPVSSEGRTLDQKRVHMALIDEVHEHPTGVVVQKMRAGRKGRPQPLIIEITNSGSSRTTICWEHHEYSEKIMLGVLNDDEWFAYVCTLDPCEACAVEGKTQPTEGCKKCDDWRDEKNWIKTNPSLDIGIPTRKYLQEQVREAEGMATAAYFIKRLNFCIWTDVAEKCIPMDRWDVCVKPEVTAEAFDGRTCFAGLDIGATSDFTAYVQVFPHDDVEFVDVPIDPANPDAGTAKQPRASFSILPHFWLPDRPVKRDAKMEAIIASWRAKGLIRTTPGDSVDYDMVLADIQAINKPFSVAKIVFDRGFQGGQMGTNLQKVYGDLVEFLPQGLLSMAAPFREMLELLKLGRLHHDGNPVLRWMASNTAAETRSGLSKPSKDKSGEKIDGITALVMAMYPAIKGDDSPSIYETPGNLRL